MMNRPISVRNIDINKISFVPGQSKSGRIPSINLKYDGQNLQLLLPRLNFPGGVMVRDNEDGKTSYTLMGSLKDCDPYGKDHYDGPNDVGNLYNLLIDLQEKIISTAVENSTKWFGKKRSEDGIRDGFSPIISLSTDKIDGERVPNGKYPPSIKLKIPVYDGRVQTDVVDSKRNPMYVTPESLVSIFSKGVEANTVVSGSIYIMAGGGFGVTWRLQTAQVFPRAKVTAADIFADENDDLAPTATGADQSTPATYSNDDGIIDEETNRPRTPETSMETPQTAPPAPARKRRVAAA